MKIADSSERVPGRTVSFIYRRGGRERAGFAACHEGRWIAYENECKHIPLTLDYGDNRFFTPDFKHFICQTHSALYDPGSGLCIRGPCEGASLSPLKVEEAEGALWLIWEAD